MQGDSGMDNNYWYMFVWPASSYKSHGCIPRTSVKIFFEEAEAGHGDWSTKNLFSDTGTIRDAIIVKEHLATGGVFVQHVFRIITVEHSESPA